MLPHAGSSQAAIGARDSATQINQANDLLRRGDFDAALKTYGQVQESSANNADLSYDLGVAQYRKATSPPPKSSSPKQPIPARTPLPPRPVTTLAIANTPNHSA